jgi:hypothetical protein
MLAGAMTVIARPAGLKTAKHSALSLSHCATALANGTCFRRSSRLGAATLAGFTGLSARYFQFHLGSHHSVHKVELQLVLQIYASFRAGALTTHTAAKEHVKYILSALETAKTATEVSRAGSALFKGCVAEAVVIPSLVAVTQHIVCFSHFFKLLGAAGISRIRVWMILPG